MILPESFLYSPRPTFESNAPVFLCPVFGGKRFVQICVMISITIFGEQQCIKSSHPLDLKIDGYTYLYVTYNMARKLYVSTLIF